MQQAILDILSQYGDPYQQRFLLALSGGVDSMLLAELLRTSDLDFEAAHCNFNLRGEDADDDEVFVQRWCHKFDIKLHHCSFDTQSFARKNGLSIQMAARELRYDFFQQLQAERNLEILLTAHHLDDALETSLINLGRGAGLRSIAGIQQKRASVIRPLLYFSKEEIQAEARSRNISWREDASNQEDKYQRNYIRHQVIPSLKKAFPHFDQSYARTHRILNQERVSLDFFLDRELEQLLTHRAEQVHLNIKRAKTLPEPALLLFHWLSPLGFHEWPDMESALRQPSGQYFEGRDHELLFTKEAVILQKRALHAASPHRSITEETKEINSPMAMRFKVSPVESQEVSASKLEAYLDFDKLRFPLELRPWQAGDRFKPLGMDQYKKLSDFLTDQKLNRLDKQKVWVLLSGNDIAWVVGQRISEDFKINHKTKSIYFAGIK